LKLVSLARWVDCSPGEVILEKGQHISEAIAVIAGDLEAFSAATLGWRFDPVSSSGT
jgi:hypothetical protein